MSRLRFQLRAVGGVHDNDANIAEGRFERKYRLPSDFIALGYGLVR
ncbi:MAG TPA: hypothetical protein VGI89_11100 [Rhizomicrobium sp.]